MLLDGAPMLGRSAGSASDRMISVAVRSAEPSVRLPPANSSRLPLADGNSVMLAGTLTSPAIEVARTVGAYRRNAKGVSLVGLKTNDVSVDSTPVLGLSLFSRFTLPPADCRLRRLAAPKV